MKNAIVIPTFWTLPGNDTTERFDHPTPIDEQGTLERTLQSFQDCEIEDEVLIIPIPLYSQSVGRKIAGIVEEFPDLNIHIFREKLLRNVWKIAKNLSPEFKERQSIENYGTVRNIGLIFAAIRNADNVIFIDDDEIITEKDYMKTATEFLCEPVDGKTLVGKAGYYLEKDDTYRPNKKSPPWKKRWDKIDCLTSFYGHIASGERLHETSVALGGNMVINRELFAKVPFDPSITRGEDIDFLLNAKHFHFNFLLDNKLFIKHLPPGGGGHWNKLKNDVYRFIYEREKLKYFNFGLDKVERYPGFFLTDDLEDNAIVTTLGYARQSMKDDEDREIGEGLHKIMHAVKDAREYARVNAPLYFGFQREWMNLMDSIYEEF